jgi:UDP-glucuronate 4-epimerase
MGRPDMAYFGFANKYFNNEPIKIYNNGDFEHDLYRDFTYIDDVIEGIVRVIDNPAQGDDPHKVFNIGNNSPEKLMVFIEILEECLSKALGREVVFTKEFEPIKPEDVPATFASIDLLLETVGFKPETSIKEGLQKFADWYAEYYQAGEESIK